MADEYGQATDQPDPGTQASPQKLANYWLGQIAYCETKYKKFWKRGDDIIKRYKNRRSYMSNSIPLTQRKMNVLWANVQTQKPVLFSQTPKANVQRRNKESNPVGRVASEVLERCLTNTLDMQPFDYVLTQNVEDMLLPGHSIALTEYVPKVENDQIGWQEAKTRYIHWKDWMTNIARNWEEVWWFGYRSYLTRKEVKELLIRTGSDAERTALITRDIVLDHRENKEDDDSASKATVWCVWDKTENQIIQISTGYTLEPLATMAPPVNFTGFFPVPRPLQATTASDSTIPVPDFDMYQDQADNVDMLVQRINRLLKSLRMRGAYAADMDSLKQLAENSSDQDMIPIDNWQLLMDKGGLEKALAWFPLETIAKTLVQCYDALDKEMAQIYQITGMSDIMRGYTEAASETATAQQLKAQYGGVRVRDRQRDVQRYIRDIMRLQSEIVAEHFTQPVLAAMSGVQILTDQQHQTIAMYLQRMQAWQQQAQAAQQAALPPPPNPLQSIPPPSADILKAMQEPTWEEVIGLLRNEKLRGFVIDVETDSTIEADQMLEQEKAEKFIGAVTQFMTAALPLVMQAPQTVDLVGEMLEYGARQFKAGDSMQTTIEETVEKIKQIAQHPPPPEPKVQAEQIKAQTAAQQSQADLQTTGIKAQAEQTKAQLGVAAAAASHHHGMTELAAEAEQNAREHARAMELSTQQHKQAMEQARQKPNGADK